MKGRSSTVRPATDDEVGRLETAVKAGTAFVGAGTTRPTFDAELVRKLVLGASVPSGVQICGAAIKGLLDLRNARGSGEACHALILTDCLLMGEGDTSGLNPGIDAGHSHLQRLSLIDCQADGVELSSATVVGDLSLDGVGPLTLDDAEGSRGARNREGRDERGACWVKARGIRVGGELTVRRARLNLPFPATAWPPKNAPHWVDVRKPVGLDLSRAQIAGSLVLQPSFESIGGVSLSGASIGGDVWAQGATLAAAQVGQDLDTALFAQSVEIRGHAMFDCDLEFIKEAVFNARGRFDARGILDFYGARIGGTFMLSGARVTRARAASDNPALGLYSASLSADVRLDRADKAGMPCEIPTMNLVAATIGGELLLEGSDSIPIQRVEATGLRIASDLTLSGAMSGVDFSGSVVDGQVVLGKYRALKLTSVNGSHPVLKLSDARVGRDLKVGSVGTQARITVDWERDPLRIRTAPLASYPGWLLCEALYAPTPEWFELDSGSGVAILAFLYRPPNDGEDTLGEVVILDGGSGPIHGLNERINPVSGRKFLTIETPEQVEDYLVFFCAYVWGPEGAFTITPGTVDVRLGGSSGSWTATAEVEYGSNRYGAEFSIESTGEVSMPDDRLLPGGASHGGRHVYAPPVHWVESVVPDWAIEPGCSEVEPDGSGQHIWNALRQAQPHLVPPTIPDVPEVVWPTGWKRPRVDLRGLKVASLNDVDGWMWFELESAAPLRLLLSGFEYDRMTELDAATWSSETDSLPWSSQRSPVDKAQNATPRGKLGSLLRKGLNRLAVLRNLVLLMAKPRLLPERLRSLVASSSGIDRRQLAGRQLWLKAQYSTDPPTEAEYSPQPYQQLAKVWRGEGHFTEANEITFERLKLEKVRLARPDLPPLRRAWHRTKQWLTFLFVQKPFGFGLKPKSATSTFVLFWAVGVLATWGLLASDVLKVDASAITTVVSSDGGRERVIVQAVEGVDNPREEIPCGNLINTFVYPLDVMIPLLDLHQESRCHVSFRHRGLEVLKGLYAVLGWLVISGLIITWSGIVRRQTES